MSGLLLCDDLIFASKVQGTARAHSLAVQVVKTPQALLNAAREHFPAAVLLDLHVPGLAIDAVVPALRALGPLRIFGYGSHVDVATLKAARQAGCDRVMPRSQFVDELESQLANWLQPALPGEG